MKKFILVLVFIFLTALFIAFNYLLWDRESKVTELKNLENVNASYNASISAQKREIDTLEGEVSGLRDQIGKLEQEKKQLTDEKKILSDDRDRVKADLQERIIFINRLKTYADLNALSEPIKKWAEALSQGNYEEAYALEYAGVPETERAVNLSVYVDEMKNTIRKVEVSEVRIDKLRGSANGEIFLDARLNVKLAEGSDKESTRFIEGNNDVYVKIDYSIEAKGFVIFSINNL